MVISNIKKGIVKAEAFIGAFMTTQIITASNNKILAAYSDADISPVTNGLNIFKDVVLAFVAAFGLIFLAMGLVEFFTAWTAHETSQQMAGIKKAFAGVGIVAIPVLIKLFT